MVVKKKTGAKKTGAKKTAARAKVSVRPKTKAKAKTKTKKAPAARAVKARTSAKKVTPKAKAVKSKAKKIAAKPKSQIKEKPKPKAKRVAKVSPAKKEKIKESVIVQQYEEIPEIEPTTITRASTVVGSLNFTPYPLEKNEEYMNDRQKEHFRKILMLWKEQLMHEVDHTVVHMKEDAIAYPDPLDRAAQEEGFNLELRTRDRERKLIKKIEMALDLITNGEYGYCEDCGSEIGIRRLEARPTADKCIDCKTYEEIREKQVGSV